MKTIFALTASVALLAASGTLAMAEEAPQGPQTVAELFGVPQEYRSGEPVRSSDGESVIDRFGGDSSRWTGETARDTGGEGSGSYGSSLPF